MALWSELTEEILKTKTESQLQKGRKAATGTDSTGMKKGQMAFQLARYAQSPDRASQEVPVRVLNALRISHPPAPRGRKSVAVTEAAALPQPATAAPQQARPRHPIRDTAAQAATSQDEAPNVGMTSEPTSALPAPPEGQEERLSSSLADALLRAIDEANSLPAPPEFSGPTEESIRQALKDAPPFSAPPEGSYHPAEGINIPAQPEDREEKPSPLVDALLRTLREDPESDPQRDRFLRQERRWEIQRYLVNGVAGRNPQQWFEDFIRLVLERVDEKEFNTELIAELAHIKLQEIAEASTSAQVLANRFILEAYQAKRSDD